MNDFSELESELKKLRPSQPSAELVARIETAFASGSNALDSHQATDPHLNPLPQGEADAERQVRVTHSISTDTAKIIRPSRFKVSWVSLGAGLAAAAVFLIFARIDVDRSPKQTQLAQNTPAPATRSTIAPPTFIPDGSTQVVYQTRDEGLHYANGYEEPLRQVRYAKRETLQWRNPQTGASLRVSYPSEEVVLTPVSAQ